MGNIAWDNETFPPGSTLLVTGVNGLIGSHVADQMLAAGYYVRGTVRSAARAGWVAETFAARHGPGRFELVEVPDLASPAIRDDLVRGGVVGIAAAAGSANGQDVPPTVAEWVAVEQAVFENMAEAARQPGSSVRSFVLTSSAWAAWMPRADTPVTLHQDSYNELAVAVAEADDPAMPAAARGFMQYMAVKALVEKEAWDWVRRERPPFAFRTVLPDTVFAPLVSPEKQPGSTTGMVRDLWHGRNMETLRMIPPQWFIDGRDLGKVYLSALVSSGLDDGYRRIFGFAQRYSFPKISEIMKRAYPDKKDFVDMPDAGWDMTEVPNQSALTLLQAAGQDDWTSLGESIKDAVESFRDPAV